MPDNATLAPPRDWKKLGSKKGEHMLLFQPRWDLLENPRTGEQMKRLVLEVPEWTNIVARDSEGRFILVQQYRFGVSRVTTEIPGGVVEHGEEPRATAARELLEETGFASDEWYELGAVEANPAFQDNLCHLYLADNARRVAEPDLDDGEDIKVVLWDETRVREAVASCTIRHSLVLCALGRVLPDLFQPPELRGGARGA